MLQDLFWVLLRSVAVPYVAFLLLRETPLEEQGALLAIGIALLIVTVISIAWNLIKILGNTILLRGKSVLVLILRIFIQIAALFVIWGHYISQYTDLI